MGAETSKTTNEVRGFEISPRPYASFLLATTSLKIAKAIKHNYWRVNLPDDD